MKKVSILTGMLCALIMSAAAFAQDGTADYSGSWKLNVSKSDLGERSRIQSMDMNVSISGNEMSVERMPKLAEGQGGGGGMGPGRGMPGGGKMTYDLSGKQTSASIGMGGEVKLTAGKESGGKLKLTQVRNLETQMGALTLTTVETWELSADGKTLTVKSSTETPRGNRSQTLVFEKQ